MINAAAIDKINAHVADALERGEAMREKIGEMTMANELLGARIDRLEAGTPFRLRRSK